MLSWDQGESSYGTFLPHPCSTLRLRNSTALRGRDRAAIRCPHSNLVRGTPTSELTLDVAGATSREGPPGPAAIARPPDHSPAGWCATLSQRRSCSLRMRPPCPSSLSREPATTVNLADPRLSLSLSNQDPLELAGRLWILLPWLLGACLEDRPLLLGTCDGSKDRVVANCGYERGEADEMAERACT